MDKSIIVVIPDDDWLDESGGVLAVFQFKAEDRSLIESRTLDTDEEFGPPGKMGVDDLVIWLVPSARVSSCAVPCPAGFSEKHRQSLPFLVEDALLQPAESQHFAYRPIDKQNLALHVLDKSLLERVLAGAADCGLMPDKVIADSDILQDEDNDAVLMSASCYRRFQFGAAQLCLPVSMRPVFEELIAGLKPNQFSHVACTSSADAFQKLSAYPVTKVENSSENLYLAECAARNYRSANNLLQGQYQPRLRRGGNQVVTWTLGVVGTLLLLAGVYFLLLGYQLNQRSEALKEGMFTSVKSFIPHVSANQNLKKVVERRLGEISVPAAEEVSFSKGLEALLRVWEAMPGLGKAQISSMNYSRRNKELLVDVKGVQTESVEAFQKQLGIEGLKAQIMSTRSEKGTEELVTLRIRIVLTEMAGAR